MGETVDARRSKLGRAAAVRLAAAAERVVVAKGRGVVTFDMKTTRPTDPKLLAAMLGPTGNLRAPAIRRGRTLLIGFNEDTYVEHLTR